MFLYLHFSSRLLLAQRRSSGSYRRRSEAGVFSRCDCVWRKIWVLRLIFKDTSPTVCLQTASEDEVWAEKLKTSTSKVLSYEFTINLKLDLIWELLNLRFDLSTNCWIWTVSPSAGAEEEEAPVLFFLRLKAEILEVWDVKTAPETSIHPRNIRCELRSE